MILETIFGFVTIRIITNTYLYEKKLSTVPNFIVCLMFCRKSLAKISFLFHRNQVLIRCFSIDTISNVKQFRLFKFAFHFDSIKFFRFLVVTFHDKHKYGHSASGSNGFCTHFCVFVSFSCRCLNGIYSTITQLKWNANIFTLIDTLSLPTNGWFLKIYLYN